MYQSNVRHGLKHILNWSYGLREGVTSFGRRVAADLNDGGNQNALSAELGKGASDELWISYI